MFLSVDGRVEPFTRIKPEILTNFKTTSQGNVGMVWKIKNKAH